MFPPETFLSTVNRPYPPFLFSLIMRGSSNRQNFLELFDQAVGVRESVCINGLWSYYQADLEEVGRVSLEQWSQPYYLERTKHLFKTWAEELLASTHQDLATYCAAYEHYMPALQAPWLAEDFVEKAVRSHLEAKIGTEKTGELMHLLNIPLEDNYYKQEEYELVTTTDLEAHVQKYRWIRSRYGEVKPYTLEEASAKKAELDPATYFQEKEEEKQKVAEAVAYARQLLGDDSVLIDVMQYIIFYRTERTDIMNRSTFEALSMLTHEAGQRGINYEELLYCTQEELFGTLPSHEELAERRQFPVMSFSDGVSKAVIGEERDRLIALFQKKGSDITELKGSIACRGQVQGTAKIVHTTADFAKVEAGDILLATMTTPIMLPVLRLAAAFVTDEGGITCHAAIISREMNKPCIIGTHTATLTFKDGDKLEVDATTGIVRKV